MPRGTYAREFKLQALKMTTDQGPAGHRGGLPLGVAGGGLQARNQAAAEHGEPVAAERNTRDRPCTEDTLAKLMQEHSIRDKAAKRSVRTTEPRHGRPAAGNVLGRGFDPAGPNAA